MDHNANWTTLIYWKYRGRPESRFFVLQPWPSPFNRSNLLPRLNRPSNQLIKNLEDLYSELQRLTWYTSRIRECSFPVGITILFGPLPMTETKPFISTKARIFCILFFQVQAVVKLKLWFIAYESCSMNHRLRLVKYYSEVLTPTLNILAGHYTGHCFSVSHWSIRLHSHSITWKWSKN